MKLNLHERCLKRTNMGPKHGFSWYTVCMECCIAIVDDQKEDRLALREAIHNYFTPQVNHKISVDSFPSAEEFLPVYKKGRYHLVFLDIVMHEMNGIELAKHLRAEDEQLLIVFQTTSREYAFDAFPVHPFDYLIKPWTQDALNDVLEEALRVIRAGDPEIEVSTSRASYHVPLRTICAAISQGHNVELQLTNNQTLLSTETFKSIAGKLQADPRFLEINRGLLINMDEVLSPKDDVMQMKSGKVHAIRVNGRSAVLSAFSQYMIARMERRMR